MTKTNTATKISDLEQLKAKEAELKAKKAALKAAQALRAWEKKTKARNPAFVLGSVRRPTDADVATLGHTHGMVCDVKCSVCGTVRVVNKQDAFQVRFCKDCRKEALKKASANKRLTKRLEGKSVEDVESEIERLQAELVKLSG